MIRHTGVLPHSMTCPFGLTETAVPVKLGEKTIGYLRIGQVLRHTPVEIRHGKSSSEYWHEHGVRFTKEIRAAWEQNLLTPPDKYNAIIRLLTFFAEQLSVLINQILLEKENAEPLIVRKAREHITKNKSGIAFIGGCGKGIWRERVSLLQSL